MGHGKRKQDDHGHDDAGNSASESDALRSEQTVKQKKSATGKGKEKTAKKPKYDVSGEGPSPLHDENKQQAVDVFKNADGDKYVDLGKKRRATVRSFKGKVFLDIREFYGADGDEKPSKKGITLSNEQWETLKRSVKTIDSFFAEHDKK